MRQPVQITVVSWCIVLAAALSAAAKPFTVPHPAIVEVIATDEVGIGRGSGTLVYVDEQYGYVLTNWHVVEKAGAQIQIRFPNGFTSPGTVVKTDDHWDLALLRIWQPKADPLPVATVVPKPGDMLTIAGYGQGQYRAARGQCIHYAAPDVARPFEMIEVSVEARQGDSGGPILNDRGELAGVLFGAGDGATTGSHIGRVKTFLDETFIEQQQKSLELAAVPSPPYTNDAALPPAYVPGGELRPSGDQFAQDARPLVDVPREPVVTGPADAMAGLIAPPVASAPIGELAKNGAANDQFAGPGDLAAPISPPSNGANSALNPPPLPTLTMPPTSQLAEHRTPGARSAARAQRGRRNTATHRLSLTRLLTGPFAGREALGSHQIGVGCRGGDHDHLPVRQSIATAG